MSAIDVAKEGATYLFVHQNFPQVCIFLYNKRKDTVCTFPIYQAYNGKMKYCV